MAIEFHSGPSTEESGAPNSAARWLTPRGPGNPNAEDKKRWADYTSSEEDEAGGPARRPPVESSDEEDAIRPLESRVESAETYFAPKDVPEEEREEESGAQEGGGRLWTRRLGS